MSIVSLLKNVFPSQAAQESRLAPSRPTRLVLETVARVLTSTWRRITIVIQVIYALPSPSLCPFSQYLIHSHKLMQPFGLHPKPNGKFVDPHVILDSDIL